MSLESPFKTYAISLLFSDNNDPNNEPKTIIKGEIIHLKKYQNQKNFIMKIITTDNKGEFKWFRYGYEYNICVTDLYVKLYIVSIECIMV